MNRPVGYTYFRQPKQLICRQCAKEFTSSAYNAAYCSKACKQVAKKIVDLKPPLEDSQMASKFLQKSDSENKAK